MSHEALHKRKSTCGCHPSRKGTPTTGRVTANEPTTRLGAFYATGPARPLAAPGPKKHVGVPSPQLKPAAVGRPGDRWEREADNTADKVTRGEKAPEVSRLPGGALRAQNMAQEAACPECAAQRQEDETQEAAAPASAEQKPPRAQQQEDEGEAQEASAAAGPKPEEQKAPASQMKAEESATKTTGEVQQQEEEGGESGGETEEAAGGAKEGGEEEPGGAQEKSATENEAQQQEDEGESQEKGEPGSKEPPQAQSQEDESEAQEAQAGNEPAAKTPPERAAQQKEEGADVQNEESESEAQEAKGEENAQQQEDEGEAQEQEDEGEAQEKAQPAVGSRRRQKGLVAARAIRERSAGEPLMPSVRASLEHGLGNDLSGVRVHSDANARDAAHRMRARAFTHKQHIWLGPGESQSNLKLMAHEATHALQQDGVVRRKPADDAGRRPEEKARGPMPGAESMAGATASAPREGRESRDSAARAASAPARGALRAAAEESRSATAPPAAAPETAPRTSGPAVPAGAAPPAAPPAGAAPTGGAVAAPAAPAPATPPAGAPPSGKTTATETAAAPKKSAARAARAGAKRGAAGRRGGPVPAPALEQAPEVAGIGGALPEVAAHPDAEKAAAERIAEDRSRVQSINARLAGQAARQKGPAVNRKVQRAAASTSAGAASAAAPSPEREPHAEGEAAHVEVLAGKRPGTVSSTRFLDLVESKLATMKTPATLEEMDDFKERGGAEGLKAEIAGGVGREVTAADSEIRTAASTDPTPLPARVPTPLAPVPPAPRNRPLRAAEAAPAMRREEEVTLEPSRDQVERDLAEHRLTPARLEKANDPRFSALKEARTDVHEHADRAPAQFRRAEAATIGDARKRLGSDEAATGAAMRSTHAGGRKRVRSEQGTGMSREADERRRVTEEIEKRYAKVEGPVREKLAWLSGKDGEPGEVDRRFDEGEKAARDTFERYVDDEMSAWKWRRYGGRAAIPLIGGLIAAGTWVYDKLKGIDEHPDVKAIFDRGRKQYLEGLRDTIRSIGETVDATLSWCEQRIAEGHEDVKRYVSGLKPSLRRLGRETAASVFERFTELREEVDAKREELADRLVDRYREAQDAIDQRIKELQAENRGLVRKFIDKLKEVVAAIRNFRSRIGPLLAEAGDVIDEIIDDPIGFLGNLLDAVSKGFSQFKSRIDEHLKRGVVAWLFGTLSSAGVNVPKQFSLAAVGGLVLEVLGLTYEKLKARAMRLVGPRAAGVVEKVTGYLGTLFREGPAGLWEQLKEDVGDLKEKILEEVKSWVITRIVTAAVKRLALMFNPAGAIIQAILTIYNVIMFFLENIDRILDLVRTVIRAAADIVRGKIQAAADKIEQAMGMTIPLILSFLARLLNLGGIAEKIRSVITRFRGKVEKAVTKFLRKLVAKFKSRFTRKGKPRGKTDRAPTADVRVREERKREALREVREAMRKGISRVRLQALVAKLRKRLKLKRAVLTAANDVEIENSAREAVKGEAVETVLAATVGTTRTAKGKLERKKTTRGGLRLGKLKVRAPEVATVRGIVEPHVTTWPYQDMPERAPRPASVSAELYGKASHLARVSSAAGARFTGELGNVEAQIRRKTPDYDSGHLIANEFGGGEGFNNLAPMRAAFNREGPYRKLENFVESKLPAAPKAAGADPEVAVAMDVVPVYKTSINTTVGHAAKRLKARLKGLAKAKEAVEARGGTWKHHTGVDVAADVDPVAQAAQPITIPTRIPKQFNVAVRFTADVNAADELSPADRKKLDDIAEARRGKVAAPTEGPLIVLEELAPKQPKTPKKKDEGADKPVTRTVKAQTTFKLPHVDV